MMSYFVNYSSTTASWPYYFRGFVSIGAAYLIHKTEGMGFSSATSPGVQLLISTLIVYLLLSTSDQLSLVFSLGRRQQLRFGNEFLFRITAGLFIPMAPGLILTSAYLVYADADFSVLLIANNYFTKIAVTIFIFNLRFLLLSPAGEQDTFLDDEEITNLFERGSPKNYLDVAYILKKEDGHITYNFTTDTMAWTEELSDFMRKVDPHDFFKIGEQIVVNRRAISTVKIEGSTAVLVLVEGLRINHLFTEKECQDFKAWLENDTW